MPSRAVSSPAPIPCAARAESLAAALVQTTPDAEEGLKAFLEKREPKFR